jgi:hypothetical protein
MDDTALLELPDDPILLKQLLVERDKTIAQRDESIQLLSQDNQLLRHRLAALLRSSYGPRAERFDPRQLLLFGLLVPRIEFPGLVSTSRSKSANRSKHGRQKLPDHLPRLPIEHDLEESEKACPCCGQERQRIGQEKRAAGTPFIQLRCSSAHPTQIRLPALQFRTLPEVRWPRPYRYSRKTTAAD